MKIVWRELKLNNQKVQAQITINEEGDRIQIKASSVGSDLTTFGPKSEWDELFFLDFSQGNGVFKVYEIKHEWIYSHNVNKSQTFKEQQAQGRRPRFSITKDIIIPKNLKPVKILKL